VRSVKPKIGHLASCIAACAYAFPVNALLLATIKININSALCESFAQALTLKSNSTTGIALPDFDACTHITRTLKQRGFNQAVEIAKVLGKQLLFLLITQFAKLANKPHKKITQ
jgi:predicted amidophosphoribosyltransferase